MKVAITAQGDKLESLVADSFKSSKYLLIVNFEEMSIVEAITNDGSFSIEELAKKVVEFDCEVIITGKLEETEFKVMAMACVTRYNGSGHNVAAAVDLMDKYALPLLINPDGAEFVDVHEEGHSCSCGGNHD